MKDLDKRLRNDITALTEEKENELISEWLSYDTKKNISGHVFTEELGELISAISKWERPGKSNAETWLNIAEEVADVQIILKMIQKRYGVTDELLAKIRTLKLTVPIPEDTSNEPEQTNGKDTITAQSAMYGILSYAGMINRLNEFKGRVISTRDIFGTLITNKETGEVRRCPSLVAMTDDQRRSVLVGTLNQCDSVIQYERDLRKIIKEIPSGYLESGKVQFEEQIERLVDEIIKLITNSEIDSYFWSFPKEKLSTICRTYWVNGIELLANWERCTLTCIDEMCEHPMLHENGRAFSVDGKDTYGKPLEVPIGLYNICRCLRTDNTTWLKNHNLKKSFADIINQYDSNPNISEDATRRIIDEICREFSEISQIVAELIEQQNSWR